MTGKNPMSQNNYRLNENLLHYLSNSLGWRGLNSIQKKAIPIILKGKNTLILAPTASGKTEAALIPIFSEILNNHLNPTSVLYVSPLKALINDMHNRIEKWTGHFGLTATKWHGDVDRAEKIRFSKKPTDFLLTTPESLEVILMNRTSGEKERIFKNVRYILIDEIHYFADSDRGVQLNSLINRISQYTSNASVIGLSATVGNPELISQWISPRNPAEIIKDTGGRKLQYKVLNQPETSLSKVLRDYTDKKVLIFANSRRIAELTYYKLKKELGLDNIFIHHGSINRQTREENEDKFKEIRHGFMVATNTLELGIDIGDIDIVVQLSAPAQTSSFSQRIGRSGRRTKVQRTIIMSQNFNLLVALAEVMLYHENRVEKIKISKKSLDILFHQTLSTTFEKGRVHFKKLYNKLTNCYAFSEITLTEYKQLLKEMQKHELIDISAGMISLGYGFEKKFAKTNYKNFYAVFSPSFSYTIYEGIREVGTLDVSYAIDLAPGDTFNLAGKLWKVKSVNHEKYTIRVLKEKMIKANMPSWHSEGAPIDLLITSKIHEILQGDFNRKYLRPFDESGREIIETAIECAQSDEFRPGILPIEINRGTIYIHTFAGDKANKLLLKVFEMYHDIYNLFTTPVYAAFKARDEITHEDIESIIYTLENILNEDSTNAMLDNLTTSFKKNKFMEFLPDNVRGNLKMNLIFDRDALIKATCDKMINFIEVSQFRKKIFKPPGRHDE